MCKWVLLSAQWYLDIFLNIFLKFCGKFICLKNTLFRDSINTSVALFWLITNSALVEVECELRKDFAFPMLLIPFGKIKEGKERVLWFFLNTPWYLRPTAGIRWVLPADEDERTDVPQECVSQCRQSLLEDKNHRKWKPFLQKKKKKNKMLVCNFFWLF